MRRLLETIFGEADEECGLLEHASELVPALIAALAQAEQQATGETELANIVAWAWADSRGEAERFVTLAAQALATCSACYAQLRARNDALAQLVEIRTKKKDQYAAHCQELETELRLDKERIRALQAKLAAAEGQIVQKDEALDRQRRAHIVEAGRLQAEIDRLSQVVVAQQEALNRVGHGIG